MRARGLSLLLSTWARPRVAGWWRNEQEAGVSLRTLVPVLRSSPGPLSCREAVGGVWQYWPGGAAVVPALKAAVKSEGAEASSPRSSPTEAAPVGTADPRHVGPFGQHLHDNSDTWL